MDFSSCSISSSIAALVDYTVYLATLRLQSHPIGLLKSGQGLVLILPYIDPMGLTLVAALSKASNHLLSLAKRHVG